MISLVHLNTERSIHLDRIRPFLSAATPDVVCLQEFPQPYVQEFETLLEAESIFVPMVRYHDDVVQGLCIFSKKPITKTFIERYGGNEGEILRLDESNYRSIHDSIRSSLLVCDIEDGDTTHRIGTTHFPVTEKGSVAEYQRTDMHNLLLLLKKQNELVFTGDFNAPRGGEIFSALASKYTDNVPGQYESSLDPVLHRAAKDRWDELKDKMVDGLFSTSGYTVNDVEMVCGVSDHCALTATISKSR